MNSNNFSLKNTICRFVMIFTVLYRLLDTKTIQLSGVCLLTLQKLNMCFYLTGKIHICAHVHAANMK